MSACALLLGSEALSAGFEPGPVTLHGTWTAESHFVGVRLLAVNLSGGPQTLSNAIVASSTRQDTGSAVTPDQAWQAVTWSGGTSVSVPASTVVLGNVVSPGLALSDLIQIDSVTASASDAQNPNRLPILMARAYYASGASSSYIDANSPSTTWTTGVGATYKRIVKNFRTTAGNFATPGTAGSASGFAATKAWCVPIFQYANRGYTLAIAADSTAHGAPNVGYSYDQAWGNQAAMLVSGRFAPVNAMNCSWGGQSMGTYVTLAKNWIAGFKPDICILEVGSPNDGNFQSAQTTSAWNQAQSFVTYCRGLGIVPVLQCPLPDSNIGSASGPWQSLINQINTWGQTAGNYVIDATTGRLGSSTTPGAWANGTAYSQDGIHPTNAAALILAQVAVPVIQNIIATNLGKSQVSSSAPASQLQFLFACDPLNGNRPTVFKSLDLNHVDNTADVNGNMVIPNGLRVSTMTFQGKTVPFIATAGLGSIVSFPSGHQPYSSNLGTAPAWNAGQTWVVIGVAPTPSGHNYPDDGIPDPSDSTQYRFAKFGYTPVGGTNRWYVGGGSDRSVVTTTFFNGGEVVTIGCDVTKTGVGGNNHAFVGIDGSVPSAFDTTSGTAGASQYGYIGGVGGAVSETGQTWWTTPLVMLAVFQGQLTLAQYQAIHADPFGTLLSGTPSNALIGRAMRFNPSTKVWTDVGSYTPVATSGCQSYFYNQAVGTGPAYCKQDPTLGLMIAAAGLNSGQPAQVTTAGYTSIVLERYQQIADLRDNIEGYVIGYDDVGGRLVQVRWRNPFASATCVASTICSLPSVAPGTAVALAFDAKRRRVLVFFPQGIYSVDLRTQVATNIGTLPSGVTSFDRAIWHPKKDVIYAWGDPSDQTKLHKFQFSDVDRSDQPDQLVQGLLDDGFYGTNVTWFNNAAGVPWTNAGGDFTDTTGTAQAAGSPYATFQFATNATTETKSADVTSLVVKWLASGNTGCFLQHGGTCVITSRFGTTANIPKLTVVTSSGTFNCPVVATGSTSGSGPYPAPTGNNNAGAASMSASGTQKVFMQFDLSSVIGTPIAGTTMTLTKTNQTDQSSAAKLLLCTPPLVQTDNYVPASSGTIASNYSYDGYNSSTGTYAIASHPNVLLFDPMTSGWSTRTNVYNSPGDGDWQSDGTDPYLGGGGYGLYSNGFAKGAIFGSTHLISFYRLGLPDQTDLYVRYMIYFEYDWGSVVTGHKFPGINGQYINGSGGQIPGTPYPGSGAGNGAGNGSLCKVVSNANTGNVPKFDGWSTRMHLEDGGGPETPDDNPYRKVLSWKVAESYSDPNNDTTEHHFTPKANMRRGRWYSIEQHVKMNTINTSVLDQYGNGVGNADGLLEVWIEDKLVCSVTNALYSHHPAYKIPSWWWTIQHGGNAFAQNDHSVRIANLVMATSRIGTIKSQPSWLASAAPLQWVTIPNSTLTNNLDRSYLLANTYCFSFDGTFIVWCQNSTTDYGAVCGGNGRAGNPTNWTHAHYTWSGMGFDESASTIYVGGGDAHWADNSYHKFQYAQDTPAWTPNIVSGSSYHKFKTRDKDSLIIPPAIAPDDNRQDRMYDGRHRGGHTYWSQQYIKTNNSIVHFETHQYWDPDQGYSVGCHQANLTSGDWDTNATPSIPDQPEAAPDADQWKAKHYGTQDVYHLINGRIRIWRASNNSWVIGYTFPDANVVNFGISGTGGINYQANYIFFQGASGNNVNMWVVLDFNKPSGPNLCTRTDVTLTGPGAANLAGGQKSTGYVWVPDLNGFIAYKDTGVFWLVTRTSPTTFDVQVLNCTGAIPPAGSLSFGSDNGGGVLSNLQYDPKLRGLVLRTSDTHPMYFMKVG